MKKLVILSTVALTAMSSFTVPVYAQSVEQQQQVTRAQSLLKQSDRLATKLIMKLEIAKYNQAIKDGIIGSDAIGKTIGASIFSSGAISGGVATIAFLGVISAGGGGYVAMDQYSMMSSLLVGGGAGALLINATAETMYGVTYNQIRRTVGLSEGTQTALNQVANNAADVLELSPEKRQRLANALQEATVQIAGDHKAFLDVGQIVLDLHLLDATAEASFRSLREVINSNLSSEELKLVMMKTEKEKIAMRIQLLQDLQTELVNTARKDDSTLAELAPLAARLKVAITALQAELN